MEDVDKALQFIQILSRCKLLSRFYPWICSNFGKYAFTHYLIWYIVPLEQFPYSIKNNAEKNMRRWQLYNGKCLASGSLSIEWGQTLLPFLLVKYSYLAKFRVSTWCHWALCWEYTYHNHLVQSGRNQFRYVSGIALKYSIAISWIV